MFSPLAKLTKRDKISELEKQVCQTLFEIEVNNKELKPLMQPLQIAAAEEVAVGKTSKAIIIFFPIKFQKGFKAVHVRLVREMEKKFQGNTVILVPQRKARTKLPGIKRPFRHTLKAVQEKLCEDISYPLEIVGKRTRIRPNQSEQMRMFVFFSFQKFIYFRYLILFQLIICGITLHISIPNC